MQVKHEESREFDHMTHIGCHGSGVLLREVVDLYDAVLRPRYTAITQGEVYG